ncbi:MAG: cobyrinate a,c-diamide synthase [Oligoflexia bacterium]|nr:cobyrinate a,c-diamide synthase [Oligoflexia bacterium]
MKHTFNVPRILVSGTSSGVGKTTFVVGLAQAFKKRNLKVLCFKCGPDYLDPTYHQMVTQEKTYNLDSWILDQNALTKLLAHKSVGYDLVIIEGAMGLFDSAFSRDPKGSSALVAKWTETPILLVVDASGMSTSLAAVVNGFVNFDCELTKNFKGVLANRVGSNAHLLMLKDILSTTNSPSPSLIGGLLKDTKVFPERHLGLTTAFSSGLVAEDFVSLGNSIEEFCDLDNILSIAQSAPPLDAQIDAQKIYPVSISTVTSKCRIAVAYDDAFHFYYEENLELLRREGAEIVYFSPLKDSTLPLNVDGLIIGGGYPELYAKDLADNISLKKSILELAQKGAPIYAECGGLMYLSEGIITVDNSGGGGDNDIFPMIGVIEGIAQMSKKLKALGYVQVVTQKPSILGPEGTIFRGHQFRYSDLINNNEHFIFEATKVRNKEVFYEGYGSAKMNVLASYIHAYWEENSTIPKSIVNYCKIKIEDKNHTIHG